MGTFFTVVALIAAAGAFFYAWISRQELAQANRRLDRYNRALFDANDEIRRLSEEQAEQFAQLRGELARLSGRASFSPTMTMREVYALHPQATEILAGYHLGGCSSCAVELDDSLETVCKSSGIEISQMLMNLNALFGANGHSHRSTEVQRVKLPNIEFSL
jgi:hypothetical protein